MGSVIIRNARIVNEGTIIEGDVKVINGYFEQIVESGMKVIRLKLTLKVIISSRVSLMTKSTSDNPD